MKKLTLLQIQWFMEQQYLKLTNKRHAHHAWITSVSLPLKSHTHEIIKFCNLCKRGWYHEQDWYLVGLSKKHFNNKKEIIQFIQKIDVLVEIKHIQIINLPHIYFTSWQVI